MVIRHITMQATWGHTAGCWRQSGTALWITHTWRDSWGSGFCGWWLRIIHLRDKGPTESVWKSRPRSEQNDPLLVNPPGGAVIHHSVTGPLSCLSAGMELFQHAPTVNLEGTAPARSVLENSHALPWRARCILRRITK